MKCNSIVDIFCKHAGNVSDKWEQYLLVYEREFAGFIVAGKPITLFEIGVQNGGSLQIWHDYLPDGSNVVGLDVNPLCKDLDLGSGIEISIGDASSPEVLDEVLATRIPDVVIDDGSHKSPDVLATFDVLWPKLASGGLYIIEDAHCSYWSSHEGGFRKEGTTIHEFKSLVDALNADYISLDDIPDGNEFSRLNGYNLEIERIAFYDSMIVIEKKQNKKRDAYKRVIGGTNAPVLDIARHILKFSSIDLHNTLLTMPAVQPIGRRAHELLLEEREKTKAIKKEKSAFEQENRFLRKCVDDRFVEISNLTNQLISKQRLLEDAEKKLNSIKNSTSWKILGPVRVVRRMLKRAVNKLF